MTDEQIQNEIQTSTKEIEKFLNKKKKGKLIVIANDKALKNISKKFSNKDGLLIVSNSEYKELTKDILDGAKIIMPQYLDLSVIKKATNYNENMQI
jgi:tRNA G18 (ribose-2'-O)-methylase SpoU